MDPRPQTRVVARTEALRAGSPLAARRIHSNLLRVDTAVTIAHAAHAAVDEGHLASRSLRLQQVTAAEQLRDGSGEAMTNRP